MEGKPDFEKLASEAIKDIMFPNRQEMFRAMEQIKGVLHHFSKEKDKEIEELTTEKQVAFTSLQFIEEEKQELIEALKSANEVLEWHLVSTSKLKRSV